MSDIPGGQEPVETDEVELEDDQTEDAESDEGEGEAGEDAGGADAEIDEDEEGQARSVAAQPRRARGRPNGEVIRELQAQNAEFRRLLAEVREAQQAPRQPTQAEIAEQQRIERERFEMMSPYEQYQYTQQQIRAGVQQETQQIARTLWDQADQREYGDILEKTPAYRRFEAKVNELRAQAPTVPRRILLATAIGMAAMEGGGRQRQRSERNAEVNRQRQEARPAGGRGDVEPQRGRRDDLEDRLRGQLI